MADDIGEAQTVFSHKTLAFIQDFLDSDLYSAQAGRQVSGGDILYPLEFLDIYGLSTDAEKSMLFALLDPSYYREKRDLTDPSINILADFAENGLDHRISPHPLIDLEYMQFVRPDLFEAPLTPREFFALFSRNLCDPGPFFDLKWYKEKAIGFWTSPSALCDYLSRGSAMNLSPTRYFDPTKYCALYDDVPKDAVAALQHFMSVGDAEARIAGTLFDPVWYREHYSSEIETIGTPLFHFLRYGRFAGRDPLPGGKQTRRGQLPAAGIARAASVWGPYKPSPEDVQNNYRTLHEMIETSHNRRLEAFVEHDIRPVILEDDDAARALLKTLAFETEAPPVVDIIIPCYDEFRTTVECLASLAASKGTAEFRILLADDASPDPQLADLADIPGVAYHRNPENLHFLRSCNAAYRRGTAPYVLLLNNDAQLEGAVIDQLLHVLQNDETIAAAVPMIVYPNGRLQEAGCSIMSNGDTQMIGVGDDPDLPQYGYDRDIAYGSGACLMVRRSDVGETLFDERFAPAYCEDVDLCLQLRAQGKRIRYVAKARAIHHLSVTSSKGSERRRVQLIRQNQQKLMEKWGDRLAKDSSFRVLAFYLPQFHPIPENDLWWGRGFTEWTNVTKARPSYVGHYQPHLPADLGYYDLRLIETMEAQQALARRYGIDGFVMYYYNFDGNRLLGRPLENLLENGKADFRFCLCWANENWTRHWDGGSTKSALMTQDYSPQTVAAVADDAIAAARLPGAITIDGLPMFLIYRPLLLPDVKATCQDIRDRFKAAGFDGVHLAYVESMETAGKGEEPANLGFDSCVQFPPQGIAVPYEKRLDPIKSGFLGHVYDYAATVANATTLPQPGYKRFPTVFPSWDNAPRQPLAHSTLQDATPERFQAYVEAQLDYLDGFFSGEERLLFVNAWNEWAEGAHLEPDQVYGHAWLRSMRDAVQSRMWPV